MVVKNIWSKIELVCINHNPPVPMYVFEESMTPFYACPRYMKKDEKHPNGHEENERGCANRISFDDFGHLVDKLSKQIAKDTEEGVMANYTNMKLHWKNIDAVILKYSDEKIVMGISNKKEIGVWH